MVSIKWFFGFMIGVFALSAAYAFPGKVVSIIDGDTVVVLDTAHKQHRIRLAGIDAPEKGQAFGSRAKDYLGSLVHERQVEVLDAKVDVYGRTVSRLLVSGQDVSLAMVKAGMSWHFKKYENEQSLQDRLAYRAAEDSARKSRLGLWADANVQSPGDFRKGGASSNSVTQGASDCPCSGVNICTGPKGGRFCMTQDGVKKYNNLRY